jgi:transcriptional antiterminator RfaH
MAALMNLDVSKAAAAPTSWLVVTTHPSREALAAEHLEPQGFIAYCPMVLRRIRHARKTEDVLRPLFPGYMFVTGTAEVCNVRPILSTRGVRSLVKCGDQLGHVPASLIDGFKAREVNGAIMRQSQAFKPGQQVRVTSGPFDGLVATVIEMDEKDRLFVLMDLLNQSVRVRISPRQVAA